MHYITSFSFNNATSTLSWPTDPNQPKFQIIFHNMSSPQVFIRRNLTEVKAAEIKQLVEKVAPFCWAQHETFLPNWTLISIQSYVYNLIWKKETQSVKLSCIFDTNILFDEPKKKKNNLLMGTCEKNNG